MCVDGFVMTFARSGSEFVAKRAAQTHSAIGQSGGVGLFLAQPTQLLTRSATLAYVGHTEDQAAETAPTACAPRA
jgi:hypothetical protein